MTLDIFDAAHAAAEVGAFHIVQAMFREHKLVVCRPCVTGPEARTHATAVQNYANEARYIKDHQGRTHYADGMTQEPWEERWGIGR